MSVLTPLPVGWVEARIEDIARPSGTWSPKASTTDEFWYVDIEALDNTQQLITSPKRLKTAEAPSRARVAIQAGDVLFSLVRPYLKNIAVVPESLDGQVASTAYCAVRPGAEVDSKYLYYALVRDSFIKSVVTYGDSPPAGHDDEFLCMLVPVAPLTEQRRIVAAIEEQFTRLDAGVAALKRAQAALKRYRAAVLKAAVEGRLTEAWRAAHPDVEPASALLGRILAERRAQWEADLRAKGKDPAKVRYEEPKSPQTEGLPELPQRWVWATVDACTAWSLYGPRFASELYSERGVPVIRTTDIDGTGVIDSTAIPRVQISRADIDKYQLQQNDLLVTRSGSIGRCAIFPGADEPCIAGAYLIQFRLVEPFVRPYYVLYFLLSPDGQRGLLSRMRAVTQANINAPAIRSIPIAIPPLAEQEQIVSEVERRLSVIDELRIAIDANLQRAERLRQAILERAFTGRLVPQDPADEPASALLERIHGKRLGTTERERHPIQHPAAVVQSVVPWDFE